MVPRFVWKCAAAIVVVADSVAVVIVNVEGDARERCGGCAGHGGSWWLYVVCSQAAIFYLL